MAIFRKKSQKLLNDWGLYPSVTRLQLLQFTQHAAKIDIYRHKKILDFESKPHS